MRTMVSRRMTAVVGRLLLASLLLCVHLDVDASGLRRGNDTQDRRVSDGLVCQLTYLDVQFESEGSRELYQCLMDDGQGISEIGYAIDPPADFVQQHKKDIGNGLYVHIPGAQVVDDGDEPSILIPAGSTMVSAVQQGTPPGARRRRNLSVTGGHPTIVIRVTIWNQSPGPSANALAGSVFGLGTEVPDESMAGQYSACSFGQIHFYPVQGSIVTNGVMEITIYPQQQANILALRRMMVDAANDAINDSGSPLSELPDHVLWVTPAGTTFQDSPHWVAFAYMGGLSSYYNDWWGDKMSAQMHEVCHNLGFQHSSEGDYEYGDKSGIMGYSYKIRGGPRMCFNGFKNYHLGWYDDKTINVNPAPDGPWTGDIAAFVHYDKPEASIVLAKVGNVHVLFNRALGINAGTQEKRNQVTLTEGNVPNRKSKSLGGLSEGQSITIGATTFEVCEINMGNGPVDYARVNIYKVWQAPPGCYSNAAAYAATTETATVETIDTPSTVACEDDSTATNIPDENGDAKKTCEWVQKKLEKAKGEDGAYDTYCSPVAQQYCKQTCNAC